MKIGIFHGYTLKAAGSNEYTRYLAKTLADQGHEVHVICREREYEEIDFLTKVISWDQSGQPGVLVDKKNKKTKCVLHIIPRDPLLPVYLTDKQRSGNVKSFCDITDAELEAFEEQNVMLLRNILTQHKVDLLFCNHLVYQPEIARQVCPSLKIPFAIFPHGSSIEYTVTRDHRYKEVGAKVLEECNALINCSTEMHDRIKNLYPELRAKIATKVHASGVGVDTGKFHYVEPSKRSESIKKIAPLKPGGGKPQVLKDKLKKELAAGDFESVTCYHNTYNTKCPDEGILKALQDRDWSRYTLFYAGALTVGKGVQTLITALPAIAKEHPDVQLIIAGAGSYREVLEGLVYAIESGDKKLLMHLTNNGFDLDKNNLVGPWEDVKEYLRDRRNLETVFEYGKNLSERVIFTGYVNHDILQHIFPCADVGIFPSILSEASPLVMGESLASGVIPIVSNSTGFRCGWDDLEGLIDPEIHKHMLIDMTPGSRVQSLVNSVTNLQKCKDIPGHQRDLHMLAKKRYDWKLRAAELTEVFNKILKVYHNNPEKNLDLKRVV